MYIKIKDNWNSTIKHMNNTKNIIIFINNSKNKLNNKIN